MCAALRPEIGVATAFPNAQTTVALQAARSFEDLLSSPAGEASPYEYASMFKADGWLARRRSAARFKLLKTLDPKLLGILRPGEKVYFVTSGTTVSVAEHFFTGWVAHYINMRALIFTTERVLLLEIDTRKRPRELVAQLPYASIARLKSTWSGYCSLTLRNGRTLNFQAVPKADRKFLRDFLAEVVTDSGTIERAAAGVENLCPRCYTPIPGFPPACPHCQSAFKSARRAGMLSLIFPGVGDFYLGHRGFAIMEMLGSGFVWLAFVILPLFGADDVDGEPITAAYWMTIAVFILFVHGVDAAMTHHYGKKGLYPAVK